MTTTPTTPPHGIVNCVCQCKSYTPEPKPPTKPEWSDMPTTPPATHSPIPNSMLPFPWIVLREGATSAIKTGDSRNVFAENLPHAVADAIVAACNGHAKLVEAMGRLIEAAESNFGGEAVNPCAHDDYTNALQYARSALAAAGEA